ncbi:FKBP-type peptidyl-prolyl cis-trans isomerase [Amphritea pacifica]|uniref:Peptidyl-prolyl cis-trans isomerase n=1 Tax=Amphritea pacifica TaxID=2811233 RepID=A0ABS2WDM0_9GAMM|nr:FKBP-type peptidyl-prolyl cis-trans isomerase [Amphritea pacifica]MBN0989808.1 FKBP-type peptidyl-prolyl cis-trans isomerase [Amphritea pacifica]MBN1008813.1 FKBP-type peptidyl-prolyl cis-trans isomerase [Amphritea pacifica]
MKKTLVAVAVASIVLVGCGPDKDDKAVAKAEKPYTLETDQQKLGYSLGLMLGERLKADVAELDVDALRRAVETVYSGEEPLLKPDEVEATMMAFQKKKMEEKQAEFNKLADENLKKGEAFLAENGKKEGVITTESGLQYEELTAGEGASPKPEDTVKVHYRGSLISGTDFDSSYSRGEPVSFPLNGVIPGWTEGLQLMKVGGKARLVLPADLAYGPGGMGDAIGPNETLVFEVELLDINPSE